MREPGPGDRIELASMLNDPDPVPVGTRGTVAFVHRVGSDSNAWLQVDVDWDNGRQLMLVVPPDEFVFVSDE